MKTKVYLFFAISMMALVSCNNDDNSDLCNNTETELSNKDVILSFSSRDDIQKAVESGDGTNFALTRSVQTGVISQPELFLSLTDKVRADDPILNEVSAEEKQIILSEEMTYYDMFGCEDYIPSTSFANLLNSNREIQLNDSVFKITEFGTLRADQLNSEKLDIAYKKIKDDNRILDKDLDFIPIIDGVDIHPYKEALILNDDDIARTRSTSDDIPTSSFSHYSAESKTLLGKALSAIFGDRSVKHHNFMKNYRVNGSLYSYNYLVYHETGCFVSMSKKRGGFFKFINGWKDVNADELFMQYKGVILELNLDIAQCGLPKMPSNTMSEVTSFSDIRIQGLDHVFHNAVNVLGYNIKEKDLYKYIGKGTKELLKILKSSVKNPTKLDQQYGVNGEVSAVRILTPDKAYIIIADDVYNIKNTKKIRKVFDSGAQVCVSYSLGASIWTNVMNSIKETQKMPVKKIVGGEVLLAGKLSGKWGGMYISKKIEDK